MPKHVYTNVVPDALASGRPLAFGDEVALSRTEVSANQRLIDSGALVELPEAPKPARKPTTNTETKES